MTTSYNLPVEIGQTIAHAAPRCVPEGLDPAQALHPNVCPGNIEPEEIQRGDTIHFAEPRDIDKPVVRVLSKVVVGLDCGTPELALPEADLRQLAKGVAAAG